MTPLYKPIQQVVWVRFPREERSERETGHMLRIREAIPALHHTSSWRSS